MRRRANYVDTSLFVDEKRVVTPECIRRLLNKPRDLMITFYKVYDILNDCRKSNPNIGLETCAIKKMKEYGFPPIFIFLRCLPYALIGVPFAAVKRNRDVDNFEVDDEGGQSET